MKKKEYMIIIQKIPTIELKYPEQSIGRVPAISMAFKNRPSCTCCIYIMLCIYESDCNVSRQLQKHWQTTPFRSLIIAFDEIQTM